MKNMIIAIAIMASVSAHAGDEGIPIDYITINEISEYGKGQLEKALNKKRKDEHYKSVYHHAKACLKFLEANSSGSPRSDICASYVLKRDGNFDSMAEADHPYERAEGWVVNPDIVAYYDNVTYEDSTPNYATFADMDVKIDKGIYRWFNAMSMMLDEVLSEFR